MFSNRLAISWQLPGDFGDYENITMRDKYNVKGQTGAVGAGAHLSKLLLKLKDKGTEQSCACV